MAAKWACRTYYNVNPFVGVSLHDTMVTIPAPPFQVPARLPHVEFSVVQGLWLGSFLSNRKKRKVMGDGLLFVGRTSDAGFIVPHISFPPSWMNLVTTAFGSSMSLFGSSSVAIACKNLLWGNQDCDLAATPFGSVPLSINAGCFEPLTAPTDVVVVWGTVYSGMSWGDILCAAIDFAIAIATDVVSGVAGKYASKAGGKLLKKAFGGGKGVFKSTVKKAVHEAVEGAVEEGADEAVKKAARLAAEEAAKKAAREAAEKGAREATEEGVSEAIEKAAREAAEDAVAKGTKGGTFKSWAKEMGGMAPTDQWRSYLTKSLELQGMMRSADLDDAAIAKIAREQGFGDELVEQLKHLDESVDATNLKWGKALDADAIQEGGEAAWKNAGDGADDALTKALKQLEEASAALRSSEGNWSVQWPAIKKIVSKILWTQLIRNWNWLGDGTEGGLFSTGGVGLNVGPFDANMLHPDSRRWDEKWYTNLDEYGLGDVFGGVDLEAFDALGLATTEEEDWEPWTSEDDGDADYWFEGWGGGVPAVDETDDGWWYEPPAAAATPTGT